MTSQGQRFRRRALRRGYKVDEVDTFLDRVEATLAGEQLGAPVSAQEVHDVVFRVRFGGYDEWQVDLHLDRVERQLAELEERGGARGPNPRMAPEPVRGMPPMSAPMNRGAPPTERLPAPMRDDRMRDDFGMRDDLGMRDDFGVREDRPMGPPPMQQRPPMPPPDPYGGRYEEPGYGPPPRSGYEQGGYEPGYDEYEPGYDGFEPGRHGKADMTAEIRLPDRERGFGGPPPPKPGGPPMGGGPGGPPMGNPYGPPMGGVPQMPGGQYGGAPAGPPMMGAPGPGPNGELYRVDQLRRTFQPRRFGSGYDPMQVDRLFEGILQAMTGRGPMPVPENDLDMLQFGLVPGGYFEAEVDAALREVKDILMRRR